MPADDSQKVQIKKVKAYPFAIELKSTLGEIKGQVVKLTMQGLLAECGSVQLQPGNMVEFRFSLPASHKVVTGAARTVKVYSQWAPSGKDETGKALQRIQYLLEIHFVELSESALEPISEFLNGLKGRSPR